MQQSNKTPLGKPAPAPAQAATMAATSAMKPVCSNTLLEAVATPTESGVSSCPNSDGRGCVAPCQMVYGQGAPLRERGDMSSSMLLTPCPPDACSNANGGSLSLEGANTMQAIAAITARVLPSTPTQPEPTANPLGSVPPKPRPPRLTLTSHEPVPWRDAPSTARQARLLGYLLTHSSITREQLDRLTGASNSPDVVRQLRARAGFDLPCHMVEGTDRDDLPCETGVYTLSKLDRAYVQRLAANGQLTAGAFTTKGKRGRIKPSQKNTHPMHEHGAGKSALNREENQNQQGAL
jgi:hypothetical protein